MNKIVTFLAQVSIFLFVFLFFQINETFAQCIDVTSIHTNTNNSATNWRVREWLYNTSDFSDIKFGPITKDSNPE